MKVSIMLKTKNVLKIALLAVLTFNAAANRKGGREPLTLRQLDLIAIFSYAMIAAAAAAQIALAYASYKQQIADRKLLEEMGPV